MNNQQPVTPRRTTVENILEIARLCGEVIRRGDGAAARDIEGVLMGTLTPATRRKRTRALWSNTVIAEMLSSRPLLPEGFGPDAVADCAPGTLGHAYAQLMREFNLQQEFFPDLDTSQDLEYFRRRMMETHDIWHVVADCPADVPGELGVIGFYAGQFWRYLGGPLRSFSGLVALNCVIGLLYHAHSDPRRLPASFLRVVRNARRGYQSRPLFAVRWEEMWHLPLSEVRAALLAT